MPLYEYRCQACGRRFEILQRMGAGSFGLICPACGGVELEKEFSTFASGAIGARDAGAANGTAESASSAACAPGSRFT